MRPALLLAVVLAVVLSCAGATGSAAPRGPSLLSCADAEIAGELYFEKGLDWRDETRFTDLDAKFAALNMCRLGEPPFKSLAPGSPAIRCLWYRALQGIATSTFLLGQCRIAERSIEWLPDGGAAQESSSWTLERGSCRRLIVAVSSAVDGGVGGSLLPPGEVMLDGDDVLYEHSFLSPKRRGIVEMPDLRSTAGAVGACNLIGGASHRLGQ